MKRIIVLIPLVIVLSALAHASDGKTAKNEAAKTQQRAKKTPPLPETLKKMQDRYSSVNTLTAGFVQKQTSVALGTTKESSGRIYIRRPDMFRWETLEPDPSILVSNGKKVWYYTPPVKDGAKGQLMVRKAADVQSRLAIDLLAGRGNLQRDFAVKELGPARFSLRPLKPAGDIEHIELYIERPTNLVYKVELFTNIGNKTELELKQVTLGPKLPEKMFNFTPPPNTEEIR